MAKKTATKRKANTRSDAAAVAPDKRCGPGLHRDRTEVMDAMQNAAVDDITEAAEWLVKASRGDANADLHAYVAMCRSQNLLGRVARLLTLCDRRTRRDY